MRLPPSPFPGRCGCMIYVMVPTITWLSYFFFWYQPSPVFFFSFFGWWWGEIGGELCVCMHVCRSGIFLTSSNPFIHRNLLPPLKPTCHPRQQRRWHPSSRKRPAYIAVAPARQARLPSMTSDAAASRKICPSACLGQELTSPH